MNKVLRNLISVILTLVLTYFISKRLPNIPKNILEKIIPIIVELIFFIITDHILSKFNFFKNDAIILKVRQENLLQKTKETRISYGLSLSNDNIDYPKDNDSRIVLSLEYIFNNRIWNKILLKKLKNKEINLKIDSNHTEVYLKNIDKIKKNPNTSYSLSLPINDMIERNLLIDKKDTSSPSSNFTYQIIGNLSDKREDIIVADIFVSLDTEGHTKITRFLLKYLIKTDFEKHSARIVLTTK